MLLCWYLFRSKRLDVWFGAIEIVSWLHVMGVSVGDSLDNLRLATQCV